MKKVTANIQSNDKKPSNLKFVSCHVCLKTTNQYAQCSVKRCKNYYCFECIVSMFNKEFKPQNYVKEYWICYSCGNCCKCQFCAGIDRNRKRRKPKQELAESFSGKSQQKPQYKQKEQNNSQVQEAQDGQNELSSKKSQVSKKRKIYEKRRLPIKRNVAFKYKTKRRTRGKSTIDVKSFLQNIKPEDKIFKIKRSQFHKASSNQSSEEESGQSAQQIESESEVVQNQHKQEKKYQKQKPSNYNKQSTNEKIKKQTQKQRSILNRDHKQNDNSSSLDYLEKNQVQAQKMEPSSNKTKRITKANRPTTVQPKLSTINSVQQKNQTIIIPEEVQVQILKNQSQQNQSSQSSSQEEKKPIRRGARGRRGSRSRNPRGRRANQYSVRKDQSSEQKEEQVEKRKRNSRRMNRAEEEPNDKQKKPLSSRQTKQLRDLMEGSCDRPRRRSRKNYAEIQQMMEKGIIQQEFKQVQFVRNQPQSSSKEISNRISEESQDIPLGKFQRPKVAFGTEKLQAQQNQQENQQQEDNDEKLKKNTVKKHYQEELQKNMRFQVDSSSDNIQEEEQPEINEGEQLIGQPQEKPLQQSFSKSHFNQIINQKLSQLLNIKKADQNPSQKIIQQKKPQKDNQSLPPNQITVHVYRKPAHHKKIGPNGLQTVNTRAHSNATANRWKQISDNHLLDIKNIQKLGMHALFARQNLRKQMNDLMKRRNQLIQKNKNQSEAQKQFINVASN